MPELFTQQNLILLVGVLLLASPFVGKTISLWIASFLTSNKPKQDFEIDTVTSLMELRNSLDRENYRNASAICRDLTFAIIYGDEDKRDKA